MSDYLGQKISVDMTDTILISGDDGCMNFGDLVSPSETLDLHPNDYIIVVRRAI